MVRKSFIALGATLMLAGTVHAGDTQSLRQAVDVAIRDCSASDTLGVPLRTSGLDLVPFYANGYALETASDSPFAEQDVAVDLALENDLDQQLAAYLRCETPVMRLTQAQMLLAGALTGDDPRTEMVAIYQHGYSSGADALVTRDTVDSLADLSGATIALQSYAPQLDLLVSAIEAAKNRAEDANVSWTDPELVYTDDQVGLDGDTPGARFYANDTIDAALVGRPDANVLTSGGETGTGAEGSVRGAEIRFSTQAASRAMSEVYVVRADYLEANREQLKRFVTGLLRAEEQVREDVKKLIVDWEAVADRLLGDPAAADEAADLWRRVQTVGMQGNIDWSSEDHPRAFAAVNNRLANTLVPLGVLDTARSVRLANYDYSALAEGVFDKRRVSLPAFDRDAATRMVSEQRDAGDLEARTIAEFRIQFEPNQSTFPIDEYREEFATIAEAATEYGGAVFTVEGHADPLAYLRRKEEGADLSTLRSIRQSARNLSRNRAVSVRDQIIDYAEQQDVSLDASQFVTEGLGFSDPRTGICGGDPCPPETEAEWRSNMRVVFRAVQVEAESSSFSPPNSW
mgnify:CR=1 FL=1